MVESMKLHQFGRGKELTLDREVDKEKNRTYFVRLTQDESPGCGAIIGELGPFEEYEKALAAYNMIMEAR